LLGRSTAFSTARSGGEEKVVAYPDRFKL